MFKAIVLIVYYIFRASNIDQLIVIDIIISLYAFLWWLPLLLKLIFDLAYPLGDRLRIRNWTQCGESGTRQKRITPITCIKGGWSALRTVIHWIDKGIVSFPHYKLTLRQLHIRIQEVFLIILQTLGIQIYI